MVQLARSPLVANRQPCALGLGSGCAVVLLALLVLSGCRGQSLVPDQWLENDIAGAATSFYQVAVPSGHAVRVLVDQHEADLVLSVSPTAGTSGPTDMRERGLESVTLVADEARAFTIAVRAKRADQPRTRYRIGLDSAPHPTTDHDRQRQTAEGLETAGKQLVSDAPPKSLEALARFGGALRVWRALDDATGKALTLTAMGDIHYGLGQFAEAASVYAEALDLSRSLHLSYQVALIENNLGVGQGQRGFLDEARAHFAAAHALWPSLPGTDVEAAATLANEGAMFVEYGDYQEALERFQSVLKLLENRPGQENIPIVLINLGVTYRALGDLDAAQETLVRSLPLFKLPQFAMPKVKAQLRLAQVALERGDAQTAEASVREALPVIRGAQDAVAEADAVDLLGQVAALVGHTEEALATHTQALNLYRRADARRGMATALHHIGLAARSLGRAEAARDALTEALTIRRAASLRDEEGESHYELGLLEQQAGALPSARSHLSAALDLVEDVRGRVAGEYSRTTYLASRQKYFAALIDVLMQLHTQQPTHGFSAEAFETSERESARSLLDALRESGTDIRRGVAPTMLEEERAEQQQVNFWSNRLARLLNQTGKEQEASDATRTLNEHLTAFRAIEARIRAASPRGVVLPAPSILRLGEIQRQILDSDTLLLRFALGERRSYAWIVTKQSMRVVTLPAKAAIESVARPVVDIVSGWQTATASGDRGEQFRRAAEALSTMLLGSAAKDLAKGRLLIVCEGLLQVVPFAALPEPGLGDPLIVRHEIVMLPSASALAALKQQFGKRPPAPKTVAVLADAVYEADDPRISRSPGEPEDSRAPNVVDDVDESTVGRLAFAKEEGLGILGLVPTPSQRFGAFGFDANLETAMSPELGDYRIVHIAAHAFSDTIRPELSSIILSRYDKRGHRRNGRLRLMDINRLTWRAELVVLSACETAAGKDVDGEGLMGLARGFFGAGAAAVIGSLNRVQEVGTLELMKALYEELLGPHKRSPAAALRAAQLRMLADRRFADPVLWSPFIVMGDSR